MQILAGSKHVVTGLDGQAGRGEAAIDQVGPVLDLLQLTFDDADQAVQLTAAGNGFEWAMLMAIAENSWLLSSGFAEGKPGQHILTPTMRACRRRAASSSAA